MASLVEFCGQLAMCVIFLAGAAMAVVATIGLARAFFRGK